MSDQIFQMRIRRQVADCAALIATADFTRKFCAGGGVDVRKLRRLTHETEETIEKMATPWRVW